MERNFSYKGVHMGSLGVQWAPANNAWDIWSSDTSNREGSADSQDGGQWYGVSIGAKEFKLPCFFEELTPREFDYIRWLMTPGDAGDLVFDERPFIKYEARVTAPVSITKYPVDSGKVSGIMVISMKAYYPYGTTTAWSLEDASTFSMTTTELKNTTEMLPLADMPPQIVVSQGSPATAQFTRDYYNGGTAPAETVIRVAGDVGDGITIYNQATGQYCEVLGLTADNTTALGKWLEIRGLTGGVVLTDGTNTENGYIHHSRGYVQMAPGRREEPMYAITYTGSAIQSTGSVFLPYHEGMSIRANGEWRKIVTVANPKNAVIDTALSGSGTAGIYIVPMNRIVVTPKSTMSLTKFEIAYAHTFK